MAFQERGGFCEECGRNVLARRPGTNHVFHLLMCVPTFGLWSIVWLLASVKLGGWRCPTCGGVVRAEFDIGDYVPVFVLAMLAAVPVSLGVASSCSRGGRSRSAGPASELTPAQVRDADAMAGVLGSHADAARGGIVGARRDARQLVVLVDRRFHTLSASERSRWQHMLTDQWRRVIADGDVVFRASVP